MKEQVIVDLYDLMLEQIRDLYDGEHQQLRFLHKAEKLASSVELIDIIDSQHRETSQQIKRLEGIFQLLNEDPCGENCDGIKGLVREAVKLAERCQNPEIRDAGLITSIQHINHYEMAGYGTAIAYAKLLERHDVGEPLLQILREEKDADMELSRVAEEYVNADAKWIKIGKRVERA